MLRSGTVIRGWTAALAAALLAVVATLAIASSASAAVSSLEVGSATVAPGGSVTVNVTVDSTAPGVGAWGLNISYDATVIDATDCSSVAGQCNENFGESTIRMNGATTEGIVGDGQVLGTITFTALGEDGDSSDLTVDAGFTLADPEGTTLSVTPTGGTITIATATEAPTAAPTSPGATAAPTSPGGGGVTPASVPSTGGPAGDDSSMLTWVLALTGLVVVAGGAWAVARARRVS
jgi:hypothetical protein